MSNHPKVHNQFGYSLNEKRLVRVIVRNYLAIRDKRWDVKVPIRNQEKKER